MLVIRNGGHRELERYYPVLEMDFDSEELLPKLTLHRGLMNGSWEFLIMSDDQTGMDVSYALVAKKNLYGYVLLKYFGVLPWYRNQGQGMGLQSMRLINRYYADTQGIIAELTEFPDEDPKHLSRLMKFFKRFGYEELNCDYAIAGTKAHIFVKPIKGTADIGRAIHRIMPDFYSRCMSDSAVYDYLSFGKTE